MANFLANVAGIAVFVIYWIVMVLTVATMPIWIWSKKAQDIFTRIMEWFDEKAGDLC